MSDYKKLLVWQKSHALAVDGIKIAVAIRAAHFAALKNQIIRAAASIPTNIVEGSGQDSEKDFRRFLRYSLNSAYEIEYHWLLAHDVEIVKTQDYEKQTKAAKAVQKMLRGLIEHLRDKDEDEP
jgi:four helix bundle protein